MASAMRCRSLATIKSDVMLSAGAQAGPAALRCNVSALVSPRRSNKRSTTNRSTQAGATLDGPGSSYSSAELESWDQITNRMVSCASIPFSILVLPQLVQNFGYMSAGNMSALSAISWEGYLSGLLGNTLLCSHFANIGERPAMMVQLVGVANGLAILTQVAWADCMPQTVFMGATLGVALGVCMSAARLLGRIPADQARGSEQMGVWKTWQMISGMVGLSVVPQVLYNTVSPGTSNYLPGLVTLLALTLWFTVPGNRKDVEGRVNVGQLPGLASTLLFSLSPLPQLAKNFLDPSGLAGLSIATMLLALLGNMLMIPRAMFVKDSVWQLGSTWAVCTGWATLLSMFIRESPLTGLRYVPPPLFAGVTVTLVCYFALLLARNARMQALVPAKLR